MPDILVSSHYLMLPTFPNTADNILTGSIPTELGELKSLTGLYLSKFLCGSNSSTHLEVNLVSSHHLIFLQCWYQMQMRTVSLDPFQQN